MATYATICQYAHMYYEQMSNIHIRNVWWCKKQFWFFFFFFIQRMKILINQRVCRTFFLLSNCILLPVPERCSFGHKTYSVPAASIFPRWEDVKINFLSPLIFSFKGVLPEFVFACEVVIWFHVLVCKACEFWMPDVRVKKSILVKKKSSAVLLANLLEKIWR